MAFGTVRCGLLGAQRWSFGGSKMVFCKLKDILSVTLVFRLFSKMLQMSYFYCKFAP